MNRKQTATLRTWLRNYRFPVYATVAFSLFLLAGCATPVGEVASWPVTNADEQEFTGEVVDVQCELTGNCAENCGDGKRQLAIRTDSQGIVLVSKNINNYSGGVDELLPFCGRLVNVNGLFTEHQGVRFFQAHNVRVPGGDWRRANRYLETWSARSGKAPAVAGKWYNHDERVAEILEQDGRLGLGPEADREYF